MTIEQLLQPRYEVIAGYPNNIHKIGAIIKNNEGEPFDRIKYYQVEKYPHLFRKLEWWEKRDIKDMPEYVKCVKTPDQKHFPDMVYRVDSSIIFNTNCYLPATVQEYLTFKGNQ